MAPLSSAWPVPTQIVDADTKKVDPKDDYYTRVSVIPLPKSKRVSVLVTAVALVADQNSDLVQTLGSRTDIGELTVVADSFVVDTALSIPGAEVEVFARSMRVTHAGSISTQPAPYTQAAAAGSIVKGGKATPAANGKDGVPGGNITLHLGTLHTEGGVVFNLSGGDGQAPGNGVAGEDGQITDAWRVGDLLDYRMYPPGYPGYPNGDKWTPAARTLDWSVDDSASYAQALSHFDLAKIESYADGDLYTRWSPAHPPSNGYPPKVVAGRPGAGGKAGTLSSTVSIDASLAVLMKGANADPVVTKGGSAGYIRSTVGLNAGGGTSYVNQYTKPPTIWQKGKHNNYFQKLPSYKPGKDDPGQPAAPAAHSTDGTIERITGDPRQWLHPLHIDTALGFINDAFIVGALHTAQEMVDAYAQTLGAWQAALDQAGATYSQDDVALAAGLNRFNDIRNKLRKGLDFFGNPPGWTPTLSLAAQMSAYTASINWAVPTLFFALWLEDSAKAKTAKTQSINKAIDTVVEQRDQSIKAFNAVNSTLAALSVDATALTRQINNLQSDLTNREKQLNPQAKEYVWEQHLLKMASAICSVIPVGQPEFSVAGQALGSLAKYCANTPLTTSDAGKDVLGLLGTVGVNAMQSKAAAIKAQVANKPPNDNAARLKFADALLAKSKALVPATNKFIEDFQALCVPDKEVAEQLAVLEAQDAVYQKIAEELKELNAKKIRIFQQLSLAVSNLNRLSGTIQASYVQQNQLSDELQSTLGEISHVGLRVVRSLANEAMQHLLLYQYFLVKAYEYQFLVPFGDVDLRMDELIKSIRTMLATAKSPVLAPAEIDQLAKVLSGVHNKVVVELNKQIQNPPPGAVGGLNAQSSQATFDLSADQIQALNTHGEATIDLMASNIIHPEWDNVKIEEIEIVSVIAQPSAAPPNQTCALSIECWGDGILRNGKSLYAVKSGADGAAEAVVRRWSGLYSGASQKFTPDKPADTSIPLLQHLIGDNNLTDKLMIYDPPAWIRMTISKDESWLQVASLRFKYKLSYQVTDRAQAALIITEQGGAMVPLRLTCNGKTLLRATGAYDVFDAGRSVRIDAEYAGNRMPVGLVDLDDANATDVGGNGPWTVRLQSASRPEGDRRLQLALGAAYYAPPLTAPILLAWAETRDYLRTHPPAATGNWAPRSKVAYALCFVDNNRAETALGPWSEAFDPGKGYIFAILGHIAHDPSGTAVERRLYRRFTDATGQVGAQEQVNVPALKNNDPGAVIVDRQC